MAVIGNLLNLIRGQPESLPAEAVAAAERALAELSKERRDAEAVLASAGDRRRDLLLRDANDKEIAALEGEIDSVRIRIEKTELAEPILLDRLQAAPDASRRQAWRAFHRRQHEAALEYAKAIGDAVAAIENLAKIGDEALAAGFASEAAACFAQAPRVVVRDMAEKFLFEIERLFDAETARQEGRLPKPPAAAAPAPAVIIHSPKALKAATPSRKAPPLPAPPKPRREPIRQKAAKGETLIRVLRGGLETSKGFQAIIGDVIAVPRADAEQLVRNGAGEFESGASS